MYRIISVGATEAQVEIDLPLFKAILEGTKACLGPGELALVRGLGLTVKIKDGEVIGIGLVASLGTGFIMRYNLSIHETEIVLRLLLHMRGEVEPGATGL